MINNKLDRSFGPGGKIAGLVLIIVGLLTILQIWSILLVIFGAFIAFTHSGSQINVEENKVRLYQNLFGIIKTGGWHNLNSYLGLTIVPVKRVTGMRSYSNRGTSIEEHDYRIFLVNKFKKPDFPIKKCSNKTDVQKVIDELSLKLKLPVYSIH